MGENQQQSRGGDQVAVRAYGHSVHYFGGNSESKSDRSKVRVRVMSQTIREAIIDSGQVFIVGHQMMDFDCMGAALCMSRIAQRCERRTFVVSEGCSKDAQLEDALRLYRDPLSLRHAFLSEDAALAQLQENDLVIMVDHHAPAQSCAQRLIDQAKRIIVIDHHRRSADYIDRSTLHYLESRASSASELVTEMLQYFDDSPRIPAFVCSALLAGITVDTKHFAFNVGSRTFEAAGYLRKNGADIGMIKQMFQDDMESFRACSDTVRNAEILPGGVALAVCEEETENAKLVAAKAADQLIDIRGIEAAFGLGRDGDVISVSGRSLGKINVQIICERLGGGGHLTMAGAQLHKTNMDDARALVRKRIEEYLQEANLK